MATRRCAAQRGEGQLVLPEIDAAHVRLAGVAGQIRARGPFAAVRALGDGTIIALGTQMFTTAIYVELRGERWGRQYCYASAPLAVREFDRIASSDDEPSGWTARRGS
jgi:hypothetical protein